MLMNQELDWTHLNHIQTNRLIFFPTTFALIKYFRKYQSKYSLSFLESLSFWCHLRRSVQNIQYPFYFPHKAIMLVQGIEKNRKSGGVFFFGRFYSTVYVSLPCTLKVLWKSYVNSMTCQNETFSNSLVSICQNFQS